MRGLNLLLALAAFPLTAQDWPQFLGPARDGVYTGPGRAPTAMVWKKAVGAGFAGPVVAAGKLIVFYRDGNKEKVEAWNPSNGKVIWSHAYATGYRDDFGFDEGPRSVPLVEGGRVYTCGAEGMLTAIGLDDGKKLWSEATMDRFQVRKGYFGAVCAPLIEGNTLMINAGGPEAGIVGLDKNSGKVLWTATKDEASYSSPLLTSVGGLKRALFFTRAGYVDLDPDSGKVRYMMPWRSRSQASVNAATPVVGGSIVFLTASYGTGAIAMEVKGDQYRKLWSSDDVLSSHYATPVYKDGYLYGLHGRQEEGQELRCVDLKKGKVMWSAPGYRAGTVTLAGDVLLVMRETGEMVVVKADPNRHSAVSKHQLLDGVVRAYPAFAGGRVFVRSTDTIASYRLE